MSLTLHLLLVEDSEADSGLVVREVRRQGYAVEFARVETEAEMSAALDQQRWDAVVADYNLPEFSALRALAVLQQRDLHLPFIIVSGAIGEELAAAAMKAGADDYVMKDNLARLVPAIERGLRDAAVRHDRRRAIDRLATQAQLLATIKDAVVATDPRGRLTAWNRAAETMYGWSEAEALGYPLEIVIITDRTEEQRAEAREALSQSGRCHGQAIHYRKDGQAMHVETTTIALRTDAGELGGYVTVARDVTARVKAEEVLSQSEERFFKVFRSSPAAMGMEMLDDGRLMEVNDRYVEFFGYSREELVGKKVADLELWADPLSLATAMEIVRRGGTVHNFEALFRKRSGEVRLVLLSMVGIDLPSGPTLVKMFFDISERKRIEEDQRRTAERLQALSHRLLEVQEQERRHLARELHDEIGQSLTAIKINLQSLQLFPDSASLVSRLEDSVQVVDRLLNQVRHISLDLRPPLLDDLGLVAALRWYVHQQSQRSGFDVDFSADSEIPRLDMAVETACFRVAQEAVTNIVRHAQASAVTVKLSIDRGALLLTIQDNGRGFDVAETQSRAAAGASVGWQSMQERMALVGGRLSCESAPQRGTEVRAHFPLTRPVLEPKAHLAALTNE